MITVTCNSTDISSQILFPNLTVTQALTNAVDTAQFSVRRVDGTETIPAFNDDIVISDGATVIFAGKVSQVEYDYSDLGSATAIVSCVDNSFEMDRILVQRTYTNETVAAIVADMVATYAPGFTATNVESDFVIERIVFNQVPISQCMRRLTDILQMDWYVDENKDIHLFSKESRPAPFGLTDTAGNYVYRSMQRTLDGTQLVNRVKVRGGTYDGDLYSDTIKVVGSNTKAFNLPYQFSNLTITVNGVSTTIGIDNVDDFTTRDVLYNFDMQSIRFENPLSDGDVVAFSGNPKVPVLAIAEDSDSVGLYGAIEKLIRDDTIASNAVARKRAAAELLAFASVAVDARFQTYTAGLRVGMYLNIESAMRGIDESLIISRLTFNAYTPTDFVYAAECISAKRYDLLDVLRKILTPDPQASNDTEVSEQLYPVNETVTVTDDPEMMAPFLYDEAITGTDASYFNAVAPASLTWVYGYYSPTSVSDTKRMGKFDRDAKYQ